jgi:hypothetical protein
LGESYLEADFGFTTGGLIGDYVWQDDNGDGNQDASESGIPGVTVYLCEASPCGSSYAIDTKVTDADGLYEFTGLPAGDYVVAVYITTVPAGLVQTGDPDLTTSCSGTSCDSLSSLSLSAGQIDRSRDFGYQPPGVIGDVLWIDANGNGVKDNGEAGIPYITVELYDGSCIPGADCRLTETNSDGYYYFGGLGTNDQSYTVFVHDDTDTDPDPDFPSGLTLTYDPDENGTYDSQGSTTLTAAQPQDLTVDFGYQYEGITSISGHIYFDRGNDGGLYAVGSDSPYLGIIAYLWNNSTQLIATTATDAGGSFAFSGLPADTYTISMDAKNPKLAGTTMTATPSEPYDTKCATCNNFNTVSTIGGDVVNQDFGFWGAPLAAADPFLAAAARGEVIAVTWQTQTEIDVVGFNIFRAGAEGGSWTKINAELIASQAPGGAVGNFYQFLDISVEPGITYYYHLEVVFSSGGGAMYGPVPAMVPVSQPDALMPYRVLFPIAFR